MEAVRVVSPELVVVDYGPTTLTISVWADEEPRPVMAAAAAAAALDFLAQLADFKKYLARPSLSLPPRGKRPAVVAAAVAAASAVSGLSGDNPLTPLAAVAGALADHVADAALALGADKVLVNNGGDIAVRLSPGREALVGIPAFPGGPVAHRLHLAHRHGVGGVATSGWRGRSFSPGIADQVAVWAESAALADAAATWLAGFVDCRAPGVSRRPAMELDPASDLGERLVTVGVAGLSSADQDLALDRGQAMAERLLAGRRARGALLCLGDKRRLVERAEGAQGCLRGL